MLNYHQLLFLKENYPYHRLLYVIFGKREFVFRTLTRKEYAQILSSVSTTEELEELICQTSLILPEEWDFTHSPLAGIPKEMSQQIIHASSFDSLELIFETYDYEKNKIKQFDEDCMNVVKAAMPEHTYEEMEEWTWDKLIKMVARAERLFELRGDDSIKILRNDEQVQEEAQHLTPDNKEFCQQLVESGMDPMFYFNCKPQKENVVDFPLIGGIHWQDEEVLYELRKQMATQNT